MERARREQVMAALTSQVRGPVIPDERLAPHTSFNVGGPADLWIEPKDPDDLSNAVRILHEHDWPVLTLGSGTNCLVSDRGIRGAVLCPVKNFRFIDVNETSVTAGAGVSMPLLSQRTARLGLTGYEWACGVPGSIGGSIVMNAGAHGGDTSESVEEVQVVTPEGEGGWLPAAALEFSYRHSRLQEAPMIVTAARFRFERGDPAAIRDRLHDYREKRRAAQPETSQCAGSIFRNPPGGSAGRLLESLRAKGMRVGCAEVSEKHANFIVNVGGALARDVRTLIGRLQELARERAGVELHPEVLFIGDWD